MEILTLEDVRKSFGSKEVLKGISFSVEEKSILEGMAVWAEVQFLVCIGETEAAKRLKICWSTDKVSPYGIGLVKYLQKYKIQESKTIHPGKTPFYAEYPPV